MLTLYRRYAPAFAAFGLVLVTACGSPAAAPSATATPTATTATGSTTPTPTPPTRVTGVVRAATADRMTLGDGAVFTLSPNMRVLRQRTATVADLRAGQYVAVTAERQPDNTLLASIVSVFAESVSKIVPTGQRPLPEGNLMTNATIDSITGSTFTVAFTGGGARVQVQPDAQVLIQTDATAADIAAGTNVTVTHTNGVANSVLLR